MGNDYFDHLAGELYAAVNSDVLDALGYRDQALDALREGEVVVATTHNSPHAAFWGELFSTAAEARGARGLILDGRAGGRLVAGRGPGTACCD